MPEHSPVSRQLRVSFYVFVVLLVTFLALTARMTMTYFLSILMGGILALLTRKFYLYLRNRRIGEKTSAGIVLTAVLFLIIGPLGAFGTIAVGQGISLGQHLAQQEDFSISSVLDRVSRFSPVQRMGIDRNEVEKRAKAAVQVGGAKISTELVSILGNLPDKNLQIVLALVTCITCRQPKAQSICGICDEPVCRSCAEFLDESTFAFLPELPAALKHSFYCQNCHAESVAPAIATYDETMEQAKNVVIIWKSFRGHSPITKKAKKTVHVAGCPDRREAIIRLAFQAASEGFNALLQAHVVNEQVRNHGHQKTSWSAVGLPVQVDERKLELADAQDKVWERGW